MADPPASRPIMPEGYGLHVGLEGILPWSWADERLAAARSYWLVTAGPDGRPHAAPIWGVWNDAAFWFGTDPASRKGRNLAAAPQAIMHLESGDEAVIVEGAVATEDDEAAVGQIVASYRAKYGLGDDFALDSMLVLRPGVVLGWRESDFPASATRWTL